jgi:hypothetical protein
LRRIGEDALLHRGVKYPACDVIFRRKRRARSLVFHKLNAGQQAQAANVANVAMCFQRLKGRKELCASPVHSRKEIFLFQNVKHGVACSHGDGMVLVGKAVLKCA